MVRSVLTYHEIFGSEGWGPKRNRGKKRVDGGAATRHFNMGYRDTGYFF